MSEPEATRLDLTPVLDRFPDDAKLVRRLSVESEAFRGMCEDYALARTTLAQLEALAQEGEHPRISDYRTLVEDLEKEIVNALRDAR